MSYCRIAIEAANSAVPAPTAATTPWATGESANRTLVRAMR